jgi:transposase-like protein
VNITQLLKELRDTKEERDILKKALAIFSKHPEKNTGL